MIKMNNSTTNILLWAPRILCILFALFTVIFAFDVFGEGYGFWQTLLALVMHLIPTGIIVLVLIISWRWEWVGGVVFAVLPIVYVYWAWGRFPVLTYLIMCTPMVLMSVLFFVNWKIKTGLHSRQNVA
jgi:hypothetical protein